VQDSAFSEHSFLSPMLAILLALAYSVVDFSAGLTSQKAHVLRVLAISAPASLVVEVALLPILGGD